MEIRRDMTYALGALIIAGLLLSFGSIGLFMRMGPAIERIRRDNVVTMDAARQILAVFAATCGEDLTSDEREKIETALARASTNLTVDDEEALVQAVTDAVSRAMTGDRGALREVARTADDLAQANSDAMWEADGDAQRLGEAGAWTAALGGLALVLLGVYALGRMRRRVIAPLAELERVLDAVRRGDEHARCKPIRGAVELEGAMKNANALIDRLYGMDAKVSGLADAHSSALVAMLDREPAPMWLVAVPDGVLSASSKGHEELSGRQAAGLRQRLDIAVRNGRADGFEVIAIERGKLALVRQVSPWARTQRPTGELAAVSPEGEGEPSAPRPEAPGEAPGAAAKSAPPVPGSEPAKVAAGTSDAAKVPSAASGPPPAVSAADDDVIDFADLDGEDPLGDVEDEDEDDERT
ncbi:MAG: hypothetical protein KC635_02465 [Myxococcales bacterium]|nr:hypothetical protein [Myxococcales bacterium]